MLKIFNSCRGLKSYCLLWTLEQLNCFRYLRKSYHSSQFTCIVLSAKSNKTVTSCFIRKVKLVVECFETFYTDFNNENKFKETVNTMRNSVFSISIFNINLLFSCQTSQKYLFSYVSQKVEMKITKKNHTRFVLSRSTI
jgi:hypothetical protein